MVLGHYQVLDEIGRGGMGIVYRGYDPLIGREVALKTVNLFSIVDPQERDELQQRLHREAQSAGRLSHPNIVTIYHVGYAELEPGRMGAFIAMEFVPGVNLESLIRSYRECPPPIAIGYLRQAAAALDYAHSRGVVHRDVKPSNLIVTPEGIVKIADFGVAKVASQTLTQTGVAVGSPHYMSPEQIRGEPVDGRSDQYALAVVAYELLTGRKPFEAPSLSALWYKITTEAPPPPVLSSSDLSRRIAPVLFRALSKDPAERFATCGEFVECLAAAVFGPAHPFPARQAAEQPDPVSPIQESSDGVSIQQVRSKGKLPRILAGSTVLAAALVISLLLLARWRSPAPASSIPLSPSEATVLALPEQAVSPQPPGGAAIGLSGQRPAPATLPSSATTGSWGRPPTNPVSNSSLAAAGRQMSRELPAHPVASPQAAASAPGKAGTDNAPNPAAKADSRYEEASPPGSSRSESRPQQAGSPATMAPVPYPNPIRQAAPQPEAVPLNYPIPPAPQPYILPRGAQVLIRLTKSMSTNNARMGDVVVFRTAEPLTVRGRTIIPADSLVQGRVVLAERSGRAAGRAELWIRLESLILPNGVKKDLQASLGLADTDGKHSAMGPEGALRGDTGRRKDAAIAATAAAAGGIASRSLEGLTIGAAAGLIAILLTRGPDLELPQGALFRMTLHQPLSFEESEIGNWGPASP